MIDFVLFEHKSEQQKNRQVNGIVSAFDIFVYFSNIHAVIDLTKIIGFNWDDGNSRKGQEKHSLTQAEAEQVFFNEPLLLLVDEKHSGNEARYHAYGKTNEGRKLHITFTLREGSTLIRVISARDMHKKERVFYDKA